MALVFKSTIAVTTGALLQATADQPVPAVNCAQQRETGRHYRQHQLLGRSAYSSGCRRHGAFRGAPRTVVKNTIHKCFARGGDVLTEMPRLGCQLDSTVLQANCC